MNTGLWVSLDCPQVYFGGWITAMFDLIGTASGPKQAVPVCQMLILCHVDCNVNWTKILVEAKQKLFILLLPYKDYVSEFDRSQESMNMI